MEDEGEKMPVDELDQTIEHSDPQPRLTWNHQVHQTHKQITDAWATISSSGDQIMFRLGAKRCDQRCDVGAEARVAERARSMDGAVRCVRCAPKV